jgi:hypothetical protein
MRSYFRTHERFDALSEENKMMKHVSEERIMESRSSSTSSDSSEGGGLCLSAATLAALKAFSIESGLDLRLSHENAEVEGGGVGSGEGDAVVDINGSTATKHLLSAITQHFDTTPKEEVFVFDFHPSSLLLAKNTATDAWTPPSSSPLPQPISFSVKGVARHRGQTLNSTGKTPPMILPTPSIVPNPTTGRTLPSHRTDDMAGSRAPVQLPI